MYKIKVTLTTTGMNDVQKYKLIPAQKNIKFIQTIQGVMLTN